MAQKHHQENEGTRILEPHSIERKRAKAKYEAFEDSHLRLVPGKFMNESAGLENKVCNSLSLNDLTTLVCGSHVAVKFFFKSEAQTFQAA